MNKKKGIVKLYSMGSIGFAMLAVMGMIFFSLMLLFGVPCWFIGRLLVRRRRKKLIAEGGSPPRAPSTLRRLVQGSVSILMAAAWLALVILLISSFTYPFFATNPLPYTELWRETSASKPGLEGSPALLYSSIAICPLKKDNFTTRELTATCNSAARYYFGQLDHPVSITISVCPEETKADSYYDLSSNSRWSQSRSLGEIHSYCDLAECRYDPQSSDEWTFFKVAVNADDKQALINNMWVENEKKFSKESNEDARKSLKTFVAEELKLSLAEAEPRKFNLKPCPQWLLADLPASGPVDKSGSAPED